MNILRLLLCLGLAVLAAAGAHAQRRGVQAVGLANWNERSLTRLINEISSRSQNFEISFLPFTFNPNRPFQNATRVFQSIMTQKRTGTLTMTTCLWFDEWDGAVAYGQALGAPYRDRLARYGNWVNNMKQWAQNQGVGGRVRFILVPVLEDKCSSQSAYENFLSRIKSNLTSVPTQYRRSPDPGRPHFRVSGASLEPHGTWSVAQGYVRSRDVYSNDGVRHPQLTVQEFRYAQSQALAKGASALLWREAYNWDTPNGRQVHPTLRLNIDALNDAELAFLRAVWN